MNYQEFVAQRAAEYGLTVEMTHRVGVAFWIPDDPLGEVIRAGLAEEGSNNNLSDWLAYAARHDLSEWLKEEGDKGSIQAPPQGFLDTPGV
jgi:hypothetical protein